MGARFTKWRAVYKIGEKYPSVQSIKSNAHALARYAALVQEANMVPIVEPEVLMDGSHMILINAIKLQLMFLMNVIMNLKFIK